jgi:alkylation response protein AidB-like acyl-CoA dehydrogenase
MNRTYRGSLVDACLATADHKALDWLDQLEEVVRGEVTRWASDVDRQRRYPVESLCALRQLGVFGVNVPREAGGLGFGDSVAALVLESVASACASTSAILMFHFQVTRRLVGFGTARQRSEDLPLLASGEWLASSAWTEAASGADKSQLITFVDGPADFQTITGEKTYCTGLEGAALIHVLAGVTVSGGKRVPTFVRVLRQSPGVDTSEIYELLGIRGSSTGTIRMHDVAVDDNAVVGPVGGGMKLMQANHEVLLNPGILGLGIARAAYEELKRLVRGCTPAMRDITEYQNTRFVLADLDIALGTAYAYAAAAIRYSESGRPMAHLECSRVKSYLSGVALHVTSAAMQLAGSRAYTTALPLERNFRDARAIGAMGPTNEIIREKVSAQLLTEQLWEGIP